jgi:hypothetical protein
VKEGLFLSWVAGERGDVVNRHEETPRLIEADFADTALSLLD